MTFWDFCAPFYDFAEKCNGKAYGEMLKTVHSLVPKGASVLEIAAGTGSISLAIAERATSILCTDISERMLTVAKKKAEKRGIHSITFDNINIFDTGKPDGAFDIVIAAQVLHLIDEPEKAAAELRRIAGKTVIMPITLTKNIKGSARVKLGLFKLIGFAPKLEFDADAYAAFLPEIGFDGCEIHHIPGKMPMAVAAWRKTK